MDTSTMQWILVALAVPFFVAFILYTIRRVRALDQRIDDYHEEQEQARQQGPVNPYEDMGRVFGATPPAKDDEEDE